MDCKCSNTWLIYACEYVNEGGSSWTPSRNREVQKNDEGRKKVGYFIRVVRLGLYILVLL